MPFHDGVVGNSRHARGQKPAGIFVEVGLILPVMNLQAVPAVVRAESLASPNPGGGSQDFGSFGSLMQQAGACCECETQGS